LLAPHKLQRWIPFLSKVGPLREAGSKCARNAIICHRASRNASTNRSTASPWRDARARAASDCRIGIACTGQDPVDQPAHSRYVARRFSFVEFQPLNAIIPIKPAAALRGRAIIGHHPRNRLDSAIYGCLAFRKSDLRLRQPRSPAALRFASAAKKPMKAGEGCALTAGSRCMSPSILLK
jgi:hypothetical protein